MEQEIKLLKRTLSSKNDFACEWLGDNSFDKPSVIVFGGDTTTTEELANGYAKIALFLISGSKRTIPKYVQIASAQYPDNYNEYYINSFTEETISYTNLALNNAKNNFNYFDETVVRLFDNQFTSLIFKNNSRLTIDEVKNNFRNINIITHSYGGFIAEQLGNLMRNKMTEFGYNNEEIEQSMQQISLLTLGNVGNINNLENKFTTLHILNKNDEKVLKLSNSFGKINQIINGRDNELVALDDSHRRKVFLHNPEQLLSVIDGKAYKFRITGKEHSIGSHINFGFDDEKGVIPSIASIFLGNSILNSYKNKSDNTQFIELPDVDEMVQNIPPHIHMLRDKFCKSVKESHLMTHR